MQKENQTALFVYGTLKNPVVQKRVFGRSVAGISDRLMDYSCATISIDDEQYLAAYPEAGSIVEGCILHLLEDELKSIDAYETEVYHRERASLESGATAWVYVRTRE